MATQALRGVFSPVLTPFKADLSPDVPRWIVHSRYLLENGCHGLCPFGTTSEANSLGMEERMEMLEQLVEAGIDPTVLMPGTGMCALPDSVRLTSHAVKLGCAGVLLLPPFYYKNVPDEGVYRSVSELVQRVGDSRLRVYLYHIPPMAQVGYSLPVIERLVADYPETIVGLKDSSGDWSNLAAVLDALPHFHAFAGSEKLLLANLRHGGAGVISAMANVIPAEIRALYDNWLAEDADRRQEALEKPRAALGGYAPIPALKAILSSQHSDPCWRTVRPPLVEVPADQVDGLMARFKTTLQSAAAA